MAYQAKVILDSVSPSGHRLTTMELTYPRIIHAEFMTHRLFSRNAASSRAIPVEKMIDKVKEDPFVPKPFTGKAKGMQGAEIEDQEKEIGAECAWHASLDAAITAARRMSAIGIAKQHANRLLEPFSWITVIVSGTQPQEGPGSWSNFFAQRCHPDAQPEMQKIACMARDARKKSRPVENDRWHIPYINEHYDKDLDFEQRIKVSVARCARVSYMNHDGLYDLHADLRLYDFLLEHGHYSPFEHVARVTPQSLVERPEWSSNFRGWTQLRKTIGGEWR